MLVACKNIQKVYGSTTVLEDVSFLLEEGEKAALIGVNGAGKTTLFQILTEELAPDGGEIIWKKGATFGYLAQNAPLPEETTILEAGMAVFAHLQEMEHKLREIENEMAGLTGSALSGKMEAYARLQQRFEEEEGYAFRGRVRGVLTGLGFSEADFLRPLSELSGGQKTRLHLGRLLLTQPDLLLLDEPTNHLDMEALQWLEGFLRAYSKAVLVISHDRYFLDKIVTKVIEIEHKKSISYSGNYTEFHQKKAAQREIQEKEYLQQQKEVRHQEEVIRTLRSFNREKSIKRAESREKMLQKIERKERPEAAPRSMRLTLTPRVVSGKDVLFCEGLSKAYGKDPLFREVGFSLKRGDKVALIGQNGVGKTTLFRMLLGELAPDSGSVRLGTNVTAAYYDQEQQSLDLENTVFQEIADAAPKMTAGEIRSRLAAFVFTGDAIYKTIGQLSGGERGRVALAKLMLSQANLLLLDEPTNHLDMFSKEILEDALEAYEGTVLYISHDRYFINRTAEQILVLTPNGMERVLGNYDAYQEVLERRRWEAEEAAKEAGATLVVQAAAMTDTKAERLRQKEEETKKRRRANQVEKIEAEIAAAEAEIASLDEALFTDEVSRDAGRAAELFAQKTAQEGILQALYDQWEALESDE